MNYLAITTGSFLGNLLDFWIIAPLGVGLLIRRTGSAAWLWALLAGALIAFAVTGLKAAIGLAPAHILWMPPMVTGAVLAHGLVAVLAATLGRRRASLSGYTKDR